MIHPPSARWMRSKLFFLQNENEKHSPGAVLKFDSENWLYTTLSILTHLVTLLPSPGSHHGTHQIHTPTSRTPADMNTMPHPRHHTGSIQAVLPLSTSIPGTQLRATSMHHSRPAGVTLEDEVGAVGETHVGGAGGGDLHPGVVAGWGVEGLDLAHCCGVYIIA
jgi:hypothetical protein